MSVDARLSRRELLALLAALGLPTIAQAELKPGDNHIVYDPPRDIPGGSRIDVIEFFWYACPHCYDLDTPLSEWAHRRADQVALRRIPAVLRDTWFGLAKVFYTLEALGELDRLHWPLFYALHDQYLDHRDDEALFRWAAQNGIERRRFAATYVSTGVNNSTERARQITKQYNIEGVPTLVVDGRYMTNSVRAGGHDALLFLLDELVAKAQSVRGKR